MKKPLAIAALMLPLALAGCAPHYYPPPPPPAAYDQIAQQGFHDGLDAGRRDIAQGRRPNVAHHPRFQHPPVPPPAFQAYRSGFRSGYDSAFRQPPPPPPPGF